MLPMWTMGVEDTAVLSNRRRTSRATKPLPEEHLIRREHRPAEPCFQRLDDTNRTHPIAADEHRFRFARRVIDDKIEYLTRSDLRERS